MFIVQTIPMVLSQVLLIIHNMRQDEVENKWEVTGAIVLVMKELNALALVGWDMVFSISEEVVVK